MLQHGSARQPLAPPQRQHTSTKTAAAGGEREARREEGLGALDRHNLPDLVGIGLTFKRDKESQGYVVKRVVPGGPASRDGGVHPGDAFLEVDGVSVKGKTPEELTKLVLGPSGSVVELLVNRLGSALSFKLIRDKIPLGGDDDSSAHLLRLKSRQENLSAEIVRQQTRSELKEKTRLLNTKADEEARKELAGMGNMTLQHPQDDVLEQISERAIKGRSPPKLSHQELLEIVGVKNSGSVVSSSQHATSPPAHPAQQPADSLSEHHLNSSRTRDSSSSSAPIPISRSTRGKPAVDPVVSLLGGVGNGAEAAPYNSTPSFSPDLGTRHYTNTPPSDSPHTQQQQQPQLSHLSKANVQQHARMAHSQYLNMEYKGANTQQPGQRNGSARALEYPKHIQAPINTHVQNTDAAPYQASSAPQHHPSSSSSSRHAEYSASDVSARAHTLGQLQDQFDYAQNRHTRTQDPRQQPLSQQQTVPFTNIHPPSNPSTQMQHPTPFAYTHHAPSSSGHAWPHAGSHLDALPHLRTDQTNPQAPPRLQHQHQQLEHEPSAENKMLKTNFEIYRAVAEEQRKRGSGGGLRREPSSDSWHSVESDRDLAMRLQTEEVMQHSLSQEWSTQSIGGFSSRASVTSEGNDMGGRGYEELDDVDDDVLRKMLADNSSRSRSSASTSGRPSPPNSSRSSGYADSIGSAPRMRIDVNYQAVVSPKNLSPTSMQHGPNAAGVYKSQQGRTSPGGEHARVMCATGDHQARERRVSDTWDDSEQIGEYHAGAQQRRGSGGVRVTRRLWVMRHGTRVDDANREWKDTAERPYDPYITEEGRRQARDVAQVLMAHESEHGAIDVIVSSPFLRCVQTAAEIAGAMGIKRIWLDNGLCEVMVPRNVAEPPVFIPPARLPLEDGRLAHFSLEPSNELQPPWPEQLSQARVRYVDSFRRLPSEFSGSGGILAVAHGDTVAQFVAHTRGIPDECVYSVPPCSIASANVTLQGKEVLWSRPWMSGDILTLDDMVE